jgi:hypothetical protein
VNARFGLQPAIGIVALDHDGRGLDAGFFAVVHFQDLDLEALAFRPARIHAQQHVRPVLALGAACPGMYFQIGVVGIGLARQHRLDLAPVRLDQHRLQRLLGVLNDLLVAFHLAEFDEIDVFLQLRLELSDAGNAVVELLALAHQLLRFLRVVPQIRVFGLVIEPVQSSYRLVPVKDASSAGLRPA